MNQKQNPLDVGIVNGLLFLNYLTPWIAGSKINTPDFKYLAAISPRVGRREFTRLDLQVEQRMVEK